MLPAQPWETVEVGVGRDHGATVLDCHGSVLGGGCQLCGRF
jgi:hypothetical protein